MKTAKKNVRKTKRTVLKKKKEEKKGKGKKK